MPQSWGKKKPENENNRVPPYKKILRVKFCKHFLFVMDWKFVPYPPNPYVKLLISNVVVLGNGVFGRWLGHECRDLMNGINSLIIETPGALLCCLSGKDTVRRRPSTNQEAGCHQTLNLLVPLSKISQPPVRQKFLSLKKKLFCL